MFYVGAGLCCGGCFVRVTWLFGFSGCLFVLGCGCLRLGLLVVAAWELFDFWVVL